MDGLYGRCIMSSAGHDKGKLFLVVGEPEKGAVLLSNGKERKLAAPKRKKLKHLILLDLPPVAREAMTSDRGVRQSIKAIRQALQ